MSQLSLSVNDFCENNWVQLDLNQEDQAWSCMRVTEISYYSQNTSIYDLEKFMVPVFFKFLDIILI